MIDDILFRYWIISDFRAFPRDALNDRKSPIPYNDFLDLLIERHGYGRDCLEKKINQLDADKPGYIEYSKIDDTNYIKVGYT
jgi:hypothetical protein